MARVGLRLERFLTPPQVAKALSVHPGKIRQWVESGELEAVNLAAARCSRPRYRISQEALQAFLERRKVVPKARQTRRRQEELPEGFVRYYG